MWFGMASRTGVKMTCVLEDIGFAWSKYDHHSKFNSQRNQGTILMTLIRARAPSLCQWIGSLDLDEPTHTLVPCSLVARTNKCGRAITVHWFLGNKRLGIQQGVTSCTSRKHGKKEPQLFSHCDSFDHPDQQSVNDCKFVFFGLKTEILRIWGLLIYR